MASMNRGTMNQLDEYDQRKEDNPLPDKTLPVTSDLRGQLIFLGTGTSHGVPVIGCGCATCTSPDPRNQRTRSSVVLGLPEGNLLIDTSPELRTQLIREGIGVIHSVLYTHEHADHLFGLDDLRVFPHYLGGNLPIWCSDRVEARIRHSYDYAFDPAVQNYPAGGVPKLTFRRVDGEPFQVLGCRIVPIPLNHGRFPCHGYRFGNIAYCTDVKEIPPASMRLLEGLDLLVLGCLRRRPHFTHMGLDEALEVVGRLSPRRTLFTHISHELEHGAISAELPPGVELAYDGLRIPLG